MATADRLSSGRSGASLLPMDPVYGNGLPAAPPAAAGKRSSPDDAAKPAPKRKKVRAVVRRPKRRPIFSQTTCPSMSCGGDGGGPKSDSRSTSERRDGALRTLAQKPAMTNVQSRDVIVTQEQRASHGLELACARSLCRAQAASATKFKITAGHRAGGTIGEGPLVLDPNIGRRVSVMYPSHGGWYGGIITDYNGLTKEHWCESGRMS